MKKLSILIYFLFNLLIANECYMGYNYDDLHQVTTLFKKKSTDETLTITSKLYLRYIEENNSSYIIAWLKDPNLKDNTKADIDIESIYAPFLIERDREFANGFIIKKIETLSKDSHIKEQLLGVVDILQFREAKERYSLLNTNGKVNVKELVDSNGSHINYLSNVQNDVIEYLQSNIDIVPSHSCFIWEKVHALQKIKVDAKLLKMVMVDRREFNLKKLDRELDKNHWFFQLTTDIKAWKFRKESEPLSLLDASKLFSSKMQELKDLLDNSKALEKWIRNNENFLQYLDTLLEDNSLEDKVSRRLFAYLGHVNSAVTTNVLSRIVLNDKIDEKERFRGIMALKNTSAPIDPDTLNELLDYGLSSDNGEAFIQNSIGMLLGTMARERINRVPEQAEEITNSILNAIRNRENKTVALAAAGNMLHDAPEDIVDEVGNILVNSDDASTRANSANALSRIEKSNIVADKFIELIENEPNSYAQKELIKATATASDFKANRKTQSFLLNMAHNHKSPTENRVEALKTLQKTDYGKHQDEKKYLREMMIGEKNSNVIKMIKKLYRRD